MINFILRIFGCMKINYDIELSCDNVLRDANSKLIQNRNEKRETSLPSVICDEMRTPNHVEGVISVLAFEGFIEPVITPIPENKHDILRVQSIIVTQKGIAFINTDSFVERKKRWELEKKTKRLAYRGIWISWLFSIVAIILSITAILIKPKERYIEHIYLLPKQEKKMGSIAPLIPILGDTLYK